MNKSLMLLKWRGMKAALMALAPHIAYSSSMTLRASGVRPRASDGRRRGDR